jgi:peptidoglycan/LPS O-acetylase OafA/YrhL
MSKTLSIIFLVFTSFSFICILGFYDSDPSASTGWAVIGSVIALGFSITALAQSYKTKSIQKTMSVVGVVWCALCMVLVFALTDDDQAAGGWGMLSMLYAIPFSIVLLVKGKADDAMPDVSEGKLQKIKELHELYKSGALTEDEFRNKKSELL